MVLTPRVQEMHSAWSPCHHPSDTGTIPSVVPGTAVHSGGTSISFTHSRGVPRWLRGCPATASTTRAPIPSCRHLPGPPRFGVVPAPRGTGPEQTALGRLRLPRAYADSRHSDFPATQQVPALPIILCPPAHLHRHHCPARHTVWGADGMQCPGCQAVGHQVVGTVVGSCLLEPEGPQQCGEAGGRAVRAEHMDPARRAAAAASVGARSKPGGRRCSKAFPLASGSTGPGVALEQNPAPLSVPTLQRSSREGQPLSLRCSTCSAARG